MPHKEAFDESRPRGTMQARYVVVCGCGAELREPVECSRPDLAVYAVVLHWAFTTEYGWLCPSCQAALEAQRV